VDDRRELLPLLAQLVHGAHTMPSAALAGKRPQVYQAGAQRGFRSVREGAEIASLKKTERSRRCRNREMMAQSRETDHFFRFVFARRFS
jgi:hypothetical protein